MCLIWIVLQPPLLSRNKKKGKYGTTNHDNSEKKQKYDITMCQAPFKEPGCFCISMACFLPVQMYMRYKALKHIQPDSDWKKDLCRQGMLGGGCCIARTNAPFLACALKLAYIMGTAVSAPSGAIRQQYSLDTDENDVKLIRCNNCLQLAACLSIILSLTTPCEGDEVAAEILNCVADGVFCGVSGCMTAQYYHEMNLRETMNAPGGISMEGR